MYASVPVQVCKPRRDCSEHKLAPRDGVDGDQFGKIHVVAHGDDAYRVAVGVHNPQSERRVWVSEGAEDAQLSNQLRHRGGLVMSTETYFTVTCCESPKPAMCRRQSAVRKRRLVDGNGGHVSFFVQKSDHGASVFCDPRYTSGHAICDDARELLPVGGSNATRTWTRWMNMTHAQSSTQMPRD